MKLKDRILELAVKKLAREASVEELQELDDFLNKDPDAFAAIRYCWRNGQLTNKCPKRIPIATLQN
jgi:hypothetical protein